MRIDVWSDVVCPWCYVGLANLDAALADHDLGLAAGEEVEVVHHSFQLDPGAPRRQTRPVEERLAEKYGTSIGQIRASQARLSSLGAERGLEFRFERAVEGNTFDAHRLLHLGRLRGVQHELERALMRAYFIEGQPIGEVETLRAVAIGVGLDEIEVDALLAGDAFATEVRADIDEARRLGVSGVPFFVVDGRYGLSGAQPPEALADAIRRAASERPPATVATHATAGDDACGPDGCEI